HDILRIRAHGRSDDPALMPLEDDGERLHLVRVHAAIRAPYPYGLVFGGGDHAKAGGAETRREGDVPPTRQHAPRPALVGARYLHALRGDDDHALPAPAHGD